MVSEDFVVTIAIKIAFTVAFSLVIALIYYIGDKKTGTKHKPDRYLFAFLFGIFYVVYDVCRKIFSKKEKLTKSTIVMACLSLAAYIFIGSVLPHFIVPDEYKQKASSFSIFNKCYYDMYGNEYEEKAGVVYYTKDGSQFIYNEEYTEFRCKNKSDASKYNDIYDIGYVYIDKNGYLMLTDEVLELKGHGDFNWYDSVTNEYYELADLVEWDKNGNLKIK